MFSRKKNKPDSVTETESATTNDVNYDDWMAQQLDAEKPQAPEEPEPKVVNHPSAPVSDETAAYGIFRKADTPLRCLRLVLSNGEDISVPYNVITLIRAKGTKAITIRTRAGIAVGIQGESLHELYEQLGRGNVAYILEGGQSKDGTAIHEILAKDGAPEF